MKFRNPMLVVTDIDKSVEFYKSVLGLEVIMDFGANKTLSGGLALQTAETTGTLSARITLYSAATALKYISKRMILTHLRRSCKDAVLRISIPSRSIVGGSAWCVSVIRITISLKWAKIWRWFAGDFWTVA